MGDNKAPKKKATARTQARRKKVTFQKPAEEELDSDDSSGMTLQECEQRKVELVQHLQDLENQFNVVKEQLYNEKMQQVETKLTELQAGTSQEYITSIQQLQDQQRTKNQTAGILRQVMLENIDNQYEAEKYAALQNFESEKTLASEQIYEELMENIKRLEENKENVDPAGGEGGSQLASTSQKEAVPVSGPYIVYMLKPEDIMEDLALIKQPKQ